MKKLSDLSERVLADALIDSSADRLPLIGNLSADGQVKIFQVYRDREYVLGQRDREGVI